jgi:mediator of RNA polymerase II transcription subunit 13
MVTPTPPNPAHGNNVQLMHPPWLSVGRAGLVHHMLPPAIRFWEKEGLGPRGGTKDVVAFALFEEGDERSVLVEAWMERVGRAYSVSIALQS